MRDVLFITKGTLDLMTLEELKERYQTALDITLNQLQSATLLKSQAKQLLLQLDRTSVESQQLLSLLDQMEYSIVNARETIIGLSQDFEVFLES